MQIDKNILILAELLKEARKQKNYSIDILSQLSGVDKIIIKKLELGKIKEPNARDLSRLANVLDIQLSKILPLGGYFEIVFRLLCQNEEQKNDVYVVSNCSFVEEDLYNEIIGAYGNKVRAQNMFKDEVKRIKDIYSLDDYENDILYEEDSSSFFVYSKRLRKQLISVKINKVNLELNNEKK